MRLSKEFSAFLDLIRVTAAVVVFLCHLSDPWLGGEALRAFLPLGKSAVIVFFVLSGYLISWSAARDGRAVEYAINRAARIYSVALPALLLTWTIDIALQTYNPGIVQSGYQLAHPWKYIPLFLTFTTDFWFLSENAFSNLPYWSLCYEVWYYVVFGIFIFARGHWRWSFSALVLLFMGPKLWLLFPLWLLGAAVRKAHEHVRVSRNSARGLLICGFVALIWLKTSGVETVLNDWFDDLLGGFPSAKLRYSQNVLGDSLVAASVGLIIFAARDADLVWLGKLQQVIAGMASVSFSLYLVHFPLLLAFGTLFPKQNMTIGILTMIAATTFGFAFERRKYLVRNMLIHVSGMKRPS